VFYVQKNMLRKKKDISGMINFWTKLPFRMMVLIKVWVLLNTSNTSECPPFLFFYVGLVAVQNQG